MAFLNFKTFVLKYRYSNNFKTIFLTVYACSLPVYLLFFCKNAKKPLKILIMVYSFLFKWRIFRRPSKIGSGKSTKYIFFLLSPGLEVHLEDMFWIYKLFAEILSWAEQSGTQFFRGSNLLLVWSSCATIRFQLFDIWWSSLDKMNDFKAISRIVFFRFGEINKSWFWVLSKKFFFNFFSIVY